MAKTKQNKKTKWNGMKWNIYIKRVSNKGEFPILYVDCLPFKSWSLDATHSSSPPPLLRVGYTQWLFSSNSTGKGKIATLQWRYLANTTLNRQWKLPLPCHRIWCHASIMHPPFWCNEKRNSYLHVCSKISKPQANHEKKPLGKPTYLISPPQDS